MGATRFDSYGNEYMAAHTHLCPECFWDEPCEMDCSLYGVENPDGTWRGTPVACSRCKAGEHLIGVDGDGI